MPVIVKRSVVGTLMTCAWLVLGSACAGTVPPAAAPPDPHKPTAAPAHAADVEARVCCESFGYGSMMVECCQKTAWSRPNECHLPDDDVGGGKRIVSDDKCASPKE